MLVNGQLIKPNRADDLRTILQSLPSIRFDIEETGRYTILGAGAKKEEPLSTEKLFVLSGKAASAPQPLLDKEWAITDKNNQIRIATSDLKYRFHGQGFGHGLGMSQWGARALADLGYDYKKILQYYYVGVEIVKE
jgi:stage II sporulation protein D